MVTPASAQTKTPVAWFAIRRYFLSCRLGISYRLGTSSTESHRVYEADFGDLVGPETRTVATLIEDFSGFQRCKSTGEHEPQDLHHR